MIIRIEVPTIFKPENALEPSQFDRNCVVIDNNLDGERLFDKIRISHDGHEFYVGVSLMKAALEKF